MGFATGRVTFRRYRLAGFLHDSVDDVFLEKLNRAAFARYGSAAADGVEVGWITTQHLFDNNFGAEKIAAGRFVHLAMRIDRNSAPAAILRSYFALEQAAALEASGREFLSRAELRQAKDAANQRAESEARSGAFRRIAAVPVVIDLERKMLYFGSTSSGANDRVQRLFADTFETPIEAVSAHALAAQVIGNNGHRRAFEDAKPAHFVDPPDDVDPDVYSLDPEHRGFFGREFLTWLWHQAQRAEGVFELLDHADVTLSIAAQMQLRCDFNLTGSVALRCDAPASAPEGRAALAVGKQPAKLGLLLAARTGEWSFTLDAEKLDVTGLALPQAEGADKKIDKAAALEARCAAIVDLVDVLDGLYGAFLKLRLSSGWPQQQAQMQRWASGGRVAEARRGEARLVSA